MLSDQAQVFIIRVFERSNSFVVIFSLKNSIYSTSLHYAEQNTNKYKINSQKVTELRRGIQKGMLGYDLLKQ